MLCVAGFVTDPGASCQGIVPGGFQGSARHCKDAPLQRLGAKSLTAG